MLPNLLLTLLTRPLFIINTCIGIVSKQIKKKCELSIKLYPYI